MKYLNQNEQTHKIVSCYILEMLKVFSNGITTQHSKQTIFNGILMTNSDTICAHPFSFHFVEHFVQLNDFIVQ